MLRAPSGQIVMGFGRFWQTGDLLHVFLTCLGQALVAIAFQLRFENLNVRTRRDLNRPGRYRAIVHRHLGLAKHRPIDDSAILEFEDVCGKVRRDEDGDQEARRRPSAPRRTTAAGRSWNCVVLHRALPLSVLRASGILILYPAIGRIAGVRFRRFPKNRFSHRDLPP